MLPTPTPANLVFLILMTAPLFFEAYCYEAIPDVSGTIVVAMITSGINVVVQLVLQITNKFDFMDMSFVSHGIIFVLVLIDVVALGRNLKRKRNVEAILYFIAIISMMLGIAVDIVRTYTIKVGDLGKASRYGACVFAICILFIYMRQMMQ